MIGKTGGSDVSHRHEVDTFPVVDVLTFQDQAADPDAAGELQRNGVNLVWHNGTVAGRLFFAGGVDIPVADGGTGASTFTTNGVLYGNGASAIQVTAQGAANTVLTANAGAPAFSASPTVTSVTATTSLAAGATPATAGAIRLGNTQQVNYRNAANDANLEVMRVDANNELILGNVTGATGIRTSGGTPAALVNGSWWVDVSGTSPTRVAAIKLRDGGATITIASVTF